MPLALVAIFGLARELGVRHAAAIVPALLWGTGTQPLLQSGMADVDLIMAAWLLVAAWFTVRYWRERRLAQVLCAGLAAGAALGTKYVAMLFAPWFVLATAAIALTTSRRRLHCMVLLGAVTVPAAFWFARNMWLTGNPLYPLHVSVFGVPVLHGWYTRETLFTSHYHIAPSDWRAFLQILVRGIGPALALVWLAGILAGIWESIRGRWLAMWLMGVGCLHVALFWFYNPYQSQDRFILAAFALIAVPVALVVDRWPVLAVPLVVLVAVHLIVGPSTVLEWLGQYLAFSFAGSQIPAVVPLTGRIALWENPVLQGRVALLGAATAGGIIALFLRRNDDLSRRIGLGVLMLLVLSGGIAVRSARHLAMIPDGPLRFYPIAPQIGYTPGWLSFENASNQVGHSSDRPVRVAYAGTNLPFYLFGRRLVNQVSYVNINEHGGFQMHDYHAWFAARGEPLAKNSTPDWDRRDADEAAWLRNLHEQRINLLFIGFTNAAGGAHNFYDRDGFTIERTWADRNHQIFRLLHADRNTRLYAVKFP